ncbi:MAG TPA: ATP synthase F1 subunit epsilon [Polyangiaceae bacterium]|nr:ATP synthase F1 subunit epsilon [Polyangiaceae bacterium]
MAEQLSLEIVTPDGVKLSEQVSELTAPSVNGEFGVLPGHRPMVAALTTGIVSYVHGGEKHAVAVGAGFVEVADDKALLLTDRFVRKADVDPVLVRKELKEVDEALDKLESDQSSSEYGSLVARQLWAATQLDLYGDPPPPRLRTMNELMFAQHETYADLTSDVASGEEGTEKHADSETH